MVALPSLADILGANVATAWSAKKLTDGTKLELGRVDREQTFKITPTGTFFIPPKQTGNQYCDDGDVRSYAIVDFARIFPDAGGHTHPEGKYGPLSSLPGPEDGRMAVITGKPAYVISRKRAFAVESTPAGFIVRKVAGQRLTEPEKKLMSATIATWNLNRGGSGVKCKLVPDK